MSEWDSTWEAYNLDEGDYTISVTVTDHAGNTATYSHSFTVDTTTPMIDFW